MPGPNSDVRRRILEEELDELQEQVSQLKAKITSRGLPHCFSAATHATIPSSDTSKAVLVLLPPEEHEGEHAMTKNNHDLGKPNFNSGGAGEQVEQVFNITAMWNGQ